MDLSTGEKWAKIASDEERDEDIKAAPFHDDGESGSRVEAVEMDARSGALSIVETTNDSNDSSNNENNNDKTQSTPNRDYEMMHRVMSKLPDEELEPFGGLPALPSPNDNSTAKLTDAEQKLFEQRMELLWQKRQEELAKAQESIADLPSMLKERIKLLKDYLGDVDGSLKSILEDRRSEDDDDDDDEEQAVVLVTDVVAALRDLEYQLSDVDMARDFHTLGGWPYLVALLDDGIHHATSTTTDKEEEWLILVDEIQALAAMTIGTAISNLGEFNAWALEDVSSSTTPTTTATTSTSALSLLLSSFQNELSQRSQQMNGKSMAVLPTTHSNAKYKSRATYKLRAIYALGSLLRGNPLAQQFFVANNGAEILVRHVLGTLSNVRGPSSTRATDKDKEALIHQGIISNDDIVPVIAGRKALAKLDYKFASKVLALGEDVVMGVVLHQEDYIQTMNDSIDSGTNLTANQLVAAFTTEQWCDLSLRMLAPPTDVIGVTASRGIKERALSAVRALAPGCRQEEEEEGSSEEDDDTATLVVWGFEEVKNVRSEWNREGSDDGLDSVYRRELLDLVDGVLEVLQQ